jgi:signal transduction histidine kinase
MGPDPERRLGELIASNRAEIERRWLERVQRDLVGGRPGIEPTHLRDGLPHYLTALAGLLSGDAVRSLNVSAEPAWSNVAREHGVTRVRIGFDINQLVHEFIILRQTIRQVGIERGNWDDGVESILADMLDAAVAASVSAYVDARDYDARKKQAEAIAFLTHELRNPLSTATLSASQLRAAATPAQAPALDTLDRSHQRLGGLIDSVLLIEQLEAGKVESRQVDVALGAIIDPALEAARQIAEKKGLVFKARFDRSASVRVDPQLTRSAIQNLADNAAKFADFGYVDVSAEASAEGLVVHVRDTCGGISEAELRTIFAPFERGTTGKSGSGLGLAIAKRAVEAQGGSIRAESSGVSGCHFWIELPRQPADR